ncbi:hypothetical protein [Nonomuraea sediminis]|nr:hypothetical protein [Nonomuraea sediminis]
MFDLGVDQLAAGSSRSKASRMTCTDDIIGKDSGKDVRDGQVGQAEEHK